MDISRDSDHDRFRTLNTRKSPRVTTVSSRVGRALSALNEGDEATARAAIVNVIDTAAGLSAEAESELRGLIGRTELSAELRALAWDALSLSREAHGRQDDSLQAARSAVETAPSAARHSRVALLTLRFVDVGQAEALLDEGLATWPEDADLLSVRALAAVDMGDLGGAESLLSRALDQVPRHPVAMAVKARLMIMSGHPEEALACARDVVGSDPALGRGLVAVSLFGAQRLDDDPAIVDAVLANLPSDWWVLNEFASALRALGRLDDALATLDRAVQMAPHRVSVTGHRGYVQALRGDLEAADVDLESAAERIGDPMLLWVRGEVARLRNDLPSAIDVLTRISPDEVPEVDISLAAALGDSGDTEGARSTYERALARNPRNVSALYGLGQMLMAEDDLERATELFELALEVAPDQAIAHALMAEAQRRSHHDAEALSEFDRALELDPTYAYALASKGQTLLSLEQEEAGIDHLRQAALVEPTTGWILDELVHAVETTQPEPDKFLRRVQRAIRDAGQDAAPLCLRRARMAVRQSRWVDAERLLAWVRRRQPDDQRLAAEHADALSAVGRKAEALVVLTELPELDSDQRWQRIDLLWALDQLDDVRQELESLYRAGDPPAIVPAALGELNRAEGDRVRARQLLMEAHAQEPDHAYTLASLGALERDEGNVAAARDFLGRALALEPEYAFALGVLIALEVQEGDETAARDLLATIRSENDRDLVDVHANALTSLGDHPSAWQVLDDFALEYGDDPVLLRSRGWVEVYLGQLPRATRSFRAAAQLEDSAPSLLESVDALLRVDAWEPAIEATERGHEQGNIFWQTALAMVWFHAGGWTQAATLASAGAEARPTSSPMAHVAGFTLRMDGRADEALAHARSAVERFPTNYAWRGSLAETMWVAGDTTGAASVFEDLVRRFERLPFLDPDDLCQKAWSLFRLDRHHEATDVLLRALSSTDQTAQTLLDLLLVTLVQGDDTQAEMLRVRAGRELQTLSATHRRGTIARFAFHVASLQGRVATACQDIAEHAVLQWQDELTRLEPVLADLAARTHWAADTSEPGMRSPARGVRP